MMRAAPRGTPFNDRAAVRRQPTSPHTGRLQDEYILDEHILDEHNQDDFAASRRGFTLIELLVVMGIIVLAASFMVPTLVSFFSNRALNNAGTLITNVMNSARNQAVTTKKDVYVVFLKRGLRVFKTGVPVEEAWVGGEQQYEPAKDAAPRVTYVLEFSGFTKYETYPETVVDPEVGVQPVSRAPRASESDIAPPGDIAIRFLPDGTIDFAPFHDVGTHEFEAKPPRADIKLVQAGNSDVFGFIDIRPTGRVVFKVEDVGAIEE